MNGLDAVLLILLVVVCVRGGRLGGLSQIASYGTAALGLLLGALIAPSIAGMLADGPGITLSLLTLTVLLACLLIAQSPAADTDHDEQDQQNSVQAVHHTNRRMRPSDA
jgi:predicted lipid-binding transport protein (Tim44 family)